MLIAGHQDEHSRHFHVWTDNLLWDSTCREHRPTTEECAVDGDENWLEDLKRNSGCGPILTHDEGWRNAPAAVGQVQAEELGRHFGGNTENLGLSRKADEGSHFVNSEGEEPENICCDGGVQKSWEASGSAQHDIEIRRAFVLNLDFVSSISR